SRLEAVREYDFSDPLPQVQCQFGFLGSCLSDVPNCLVTEICSKGAVICRVNPRHQLLERFPEPRHGAKSSVNHLVRTHWAAQPDPSNQKVAQHEENQIVKG